MSALPAELLESPVSKLDLATAALRCGDLSKQYPSVVTRALARRGIETVGALLLQGAAELRRGEAPLSKRAVYVVEEALSLERHRRGNERIRLRSESRLEATGWDVKKAVAKEIQRVELGIEKLKAKLRRLRIEAARLQGPEEAKSGG